MELLHDRARRRLHSLACQLGPGPRSDCSWPRRHSLSAQICSTGVGETIFRRDSRVHFARQGSDYHGHFMHQAKLKQVANSKDKDEDVPVSTLGTGSVGGKWSSPAGETTRESSKDGLGPSFAAVAPLYGQPVPRKSVDKLVTGDPDRNNEVHASTSSPRSGSGSKVKSNLEGSEEGLKKDSDRRPAGTETTKESSADSVKRQADCFGFEWFPRMDVVESGTAYVITIELPGVSADGIHVEVVRGSLIVTGSRVTDWWKTNGNGSNGGSTVYHRRELAQGPYRAVWRLPKQGDINGTTAEFIDGFLRVTVPKIKMMTYL